MVENSVLAQIRKLDEQKAKLLQEAKQQALATAEKAIAELNELGFTYRLVEGGKPSASRSPAGRRTGIREEVLKTVQDAGPDGITSASIRERLGLTDKQGAQSVSNALSALKRANKIADKNGAYIAA